MTSGKNKENIYQWLTILTMLLICIIIYNILTPAQNIIYNHTITHELMIHIEEEIKNQMKVSIYDNVIIWTIYMILLLGLAFIIIIGCIADKMENLRRELDRCNNNIVVILQKLDAIKNMI